MRELNLIIYRNLEAEGKEGSILQDMSFLMDHYEDPKYENRHLQAFCMIV